MLVEPLGQWAYTVVFGLLALHSLVRVVVDRRWGFQVVSHLLHTVMALVMVAMAWPWWYSLPVAEQVVFFGASAIWYAVVAVLVGVGRIRTDQLGGHGLWHQVIHVVMMLAMVWMVVVMADSPAPVPGIGHQHGALGAAGALFGTAGTAALVVATVVLVVDVAEQSARRGWTLRGRIGDSTAGIGMCAGMASMCWLMLAH